MSFGYGEGINKQSRTVFDYGPPRPEYVPEQEPAPPDENLQGADKAAAEVEYEDAVAAYRQRRAAYLEAMHAYRDWHAAHAAAYPVKLVVPVVDAKEWVDRDPARYRFDFDSAHAPAA